jgi:hypothetical protein
MESLQPWPPQVVRSFAEPHGFIVEIPTRDTKRFLKNGHVEK